MAAATLQLVVAGVVTAAAAAASTTDAASSAANCSAQHWSEPGDVVVRHEKVDEPFASHALFPTTISTTRLEDTDLRTALIEWARAQIASMRHERPEQPFDNDAFYSWQTQTQVPLGQEHELPPLFTSSSTSMDPVRRLRRLARQQCTRHLSAGVAADELNEWQHHLGSRELIAWAATYDGTEGGHGTHDHGDALCSGVLYLRVPRGAPPLIFADPRLVGARLAYAADGGYSNMDDGRPQLDDATLRQLQRVDKWMSKRTSVLKQVGERVDLAFASRREAGGPFRHKALFAPSDGDVVLFPPWLFHQVPAQWAPDGDADGSERVMFAFNLLQKASASVA